jgi:RNA polymerase sigma-70 factor (ECF subfamily)
MAKKKITTASGKRNQTKGSAPNAESQVAAGCEVHQIAAGEHPALTTNQGVALSDNQNSLKANAVMGCCLKARIKTRVMTREITVATCTTSATPINAPPPVGVIPLRAENQRDDSEGTLVQRAQRGDESAFATLFQLHKMRVYSVCLRMTNDVAEAEDLTQEAFMQVFRSINSFRGDSAFSTWLYRVAVNTVLMKLRRRKSPPVLSLDEPVSSDSPTLKREVGKDDLSLCGAIDRIALRRAVEELPRGCWQIFNLHEVEGYQHREIAELLQCSIGNSKSQLYKAKRKMRDLLFPQRRVLR